MQRNTKTRGDGTSYNELPLGRRKGLRGEKKGRRGKTVGTVGWLPMSQQHVELVRTPSAHAKSKRQGKEEKHPQKREP